MRRRAGAILRDSRPATIIRSACRGDPRNTSAPKRAMSYREQLIAIISMAQHARPNVTGQIADRRAQLTTFSTVVVITGISMSASRPMRPPGCLGGAARRPPGGTRHGTPVEDALAPHVDVAHQQDQEERGDLNEADPAEVAQRHRP